MNFTIQGFNWNYLFSIEDTNYAYNSFALSFKRNYDLCTQYTGERNLLMSHLLTSHLPSSHCSQENYSHK